MSLKIILIHVYLMSKILHFNNVSAANHYKVKFQFLAANGIY